MSRWGIYDANGLKINTIFMKDGFKPKMGAYLSWEDTGQPKTTVQALPMLPVTPQRVPMIGDTVNLSNGTVATPAAVLDPFTGQLCGPKIVPLSYKSTA